MKKIPWGILFFIVLGADLFCIQLGYHAPQYLLKSLLMPLLILFVVTASSPGTGILPWAGTALVFSWAGDVLLMFQEKKEIFFMLGLGAFLLAHVFYILLFNRIRIREGIRSSVWLLFIVVIYYGVLVWLLNPYLGDKRLPVRVYGIVISFMLMLAMHLINISDRTAGRWILFGAVLFVISDSGLAINKFYLPFSGADIVIMLTYGLAQYLIAGGIVRYTRTSISG